MKAFSTLPRSLSHYQMEFSVILKISLFFLVGERVLSFSRGYSQYLLPAVDWMEYFWEIDIFITSFNSDIEPDIVNLMAENQHLPLHDYYSLCQTSTVGLKSVTLPFVSFRFGFIV